MGKNFEADLKSTQLPSSVAELPVQHLQLRNSTARAAAQLRTVGAAADALDTKNSPLHLEKALVRKELASALADLRACVRPDGTVDFERFYTGRPVRNTAGKMYFSSQQLERFAAKNSDMGIGVLQLRVQIARPLLELRVSTIRKLLNALRAGLPIPYSKARQVAELVPRLTALARCSNVHGVADWNEFAKHLRIPIAGCDLASDSGGTLLSNFYAAVAAAVRFQFGDIAYLIMKRRLVAPYRAGMKLRDIGRQTGITREGVRLWEATILSDLRRIICENDYTNWRCRLPDEYRCQIAGFLSLFHIPNCSLFLRDEWSAAAREYFGLHDESPLVETRLLAGLADLNQFQLGRQGSWNALAANGKSAHTLQKARAVINKLLTVKHPNGLSLSQLRKILAANVEQFGLSARDVRCLLATLPHIQYGADTRTYRVSQSRLRLEDALEQTLRQAGEPVSLRDFQQRFRDESGQPRWGIRHISNEVGKDSRFVSIAHSGKRALREWAQLETRSVVAIAAEILQRASGPVPQAELIAAISQRRPLNCKSLPRLLGQDRRFKRASVDSWALAD